MNIQELGQAFRKVYASVKDGRIFVFDLNMEEGFKARWRGSFGIVGDDHASILRSSYDKRRRTGKMDITMFFRKEELWKRSGLSLAETCYSENQIKSALRSSGFGKVDSYDFRRDLHLPEVGRIFFVGHK